MPGIGILHRSGRGQRLPAASAPISKTPHTHRRKDPSDETLLDIPCVTARRRRRFAPPPGPTSFRAKSSTTPASSRSSTAKRSTGWHVSAETGHSGASGNKSGGRWVVEDGAITGSQDIPGNGGILITDKQYGDFEVVLEMNNDFGPDSGLFLRSNEKGQAYQYLVDYHAKGNLAGLYGEGLQAGLPRPQFRLPGQGDRDQAERRFAPSRCRSSRPIGRSSGRTASGTPSGRRSSAIRPTSPPGSTASNSWIGRTTKPRAAGDQRGHRPASSRRRRLHQAVRPLSRSEGEGDQIGLRL